ncbi:NACHT domain-containing protein [Agromyces mangrovi Wang et al. 2018]|uniref:hypothetical protein n=1 Tax=Agromyces mangrovi TaxID=1858653 RepID=UPI002573808B|nr:hypothetical protein [Agromyces mangrovi]
MLEQRWNIVGELAAQNIRDERQDANSISWASVVDVVARVAAVESARAEELLNELIRDTGVLSIGRVRETVHFMHLTFCEFAAAHYVAMSLQDGISRLLESYSRFVNSDKAQLRNRLDEVVPFSCALTAPRDRADALSRVHSVVSDPFVVARTVLESQAYEHPIFASWLDHESLLLTSTVESDWDRVWLRRLQVLTRVLRDSEEHARVLGKTPGVTASAVLEGLVQGSSERLTLLFGEVAQNDPVAAFNLAEDLGVDFVRGDPEILVSACESPAFLARAVDVSRSAKDDAFLWAAIFVEAAQRYRMVAWRLRYTASSGAIQTAAHRVSSSEQWSPESPGSDFYADCLTVAVNGAHQLNSESSLQCLLRLPGLVHVGRRKVAAFWRRASIIGTIVVLLTLGVFVYQVVASSPDLDGAPDFLRFFLPVLAFVFLVQLATMGLDAYIVLRRSWFSRVRNLDSYWDYLVRLPWSVFMGLPSSIQRRLRTERQIRDLEALRMDG